MAIEFGTAKQLRFKRQSAKGSLAGTSGGQVLRRKTSAFELQKEQYTTEDEITASRQLLSNRHGVKLVNGSVNGLLSPGTYSDIFSAILMQDFAAVSALTGLSLTIAGAGPSYTVTRGSGDFLSGGIKIGMVVRITAGSFANAVNLNNNLFVTGVTATILTVIPLNGVALVAEGPIASSTVTVPGKVAYVPSTGHTAIYYTVEEWYPTAASSERNLDVKFIRAEMSLPGSGNSEVTFAALGLDQTKNTTAYFTSPTAETSTEVLAAANGVLIVNGSTIATVTDLSFTIDARGAAADGVVGTNVRPDVFVGKVMVSGQFTAYFESPALSDLFLNETNIGLVSALAGSSLPGADFITMSISRLKLASATPDDNETGLKRTYNFTATKNLSGGAALADRDTTIQMHDSAAA